MKARYIRAQVLEQLRADIAKNLEQYRVGDFSVLLQDSGLYLEVSSELSIEKIEEMLLPEEVSTQYEAENCAIFFKALKNLTPYQARDERLWAYLTHTHLLGYCRKRWPIPSNDHEAVKHIETHFFASTVRGIDRDNAASRLWWMAYLCSEVTAFPLEKSLEIFLFRADVRANIIERPSISQNTQIFSTILRELGASYAGDKALFERKHFRDLMIRMNSIGGYKLLDYMPESQVNKLVHDLIIETQPEQQNEGQTNSSSLQAKGEHDASKIKKQDRENGGATERGPKAASGGKGTKAKPPKAKTKKRRPKKKQR